MARPVVGGDVDVLRRGGKGCGGAEGDAGKREDKFPKVHICQCEFVASAGVAGRQRIMECAAGAVSAIKSKRVSPGRRNDYVAPAAGCLSLSRGRSGISSVLSL